MVFNDLHDNVKKMDIRKIAVAGAEKEEILKACDHAKKEKIAEFCLIGDKNKIENGLEQLGLNKEEYEIIDEKEDSRKAHIACQLFAEKKTDLIMKGGISTGTLLKKVLDKDFGLRGSGFLSHVACIQWENRLIGVTDGGLNIAPTLEEKILITKNAIDFYNKIGIFNPKVALVSAVETPTTKMQSTIDASIIAKMAQRGDIKGAVVDGPFGFDNAVSLKAARIKGIDSEVAGRADILVAPNIESANMCAKGIIYASGFQNGGVIVGSTAPIILLSRADDAQTKFNSILMACSYIQ